MFIAIILAILTLFSVTEYKYACEAKEKINYGEFEKYMVPWEREVKADDGLPEPTDDMQVESEDHIADALAYVTEETDKGLRNGSADPDYLNLFLEKLPPPNMRDVTDLTSKEYTLKN